jgi:S-DNA-T family DNA segregation ATPase FtsK/SpoIIIE
MVKLILVDPKVVEMAAFKDIPHLMCPVINDMARVQPTLEWLTTKMDERYELLAEARVRNIAEYNKLGAAEIRRRFAPTCEEEDARIPKRMPYVVMIVDELADLMMQAGKDVEKCIIRLAQKSRAVGIHLILATQRPSVNVVTGLIKSNLPARMSFRVASKQESRIVLDYNGAETLLGQGDLLFLQPGTSKLVRAQGTFVEDEEIHTTVDLLRKHGEPEFDADLITLSSGGEEDTGQRDELFDEAVRIILQTKRGSVSLLQRRLNVGYARASRLIDQMADAGIVGAYKGSQAREVMMTLSEWEDLRQQRDREEAEEQERSAPPAASAGESEADDPPFDV